MKFTWKKLNMSRYVLEVDGEQAEGYTYVFEEIGINHFGRGPSSIILRISSYSGFKGNRDSIVESLDPNGESCYPKILPIETPIEAVRYDIIHAYITHNNLISMV